ncbi:MAG TPA: WGxxGxxG family protein [Bryobacteraceae bacterium]|nr:WGxxGxxG family protein [Bryobacteraceae bacterium]
MQTLCKGSAGRNGHARALLLSAMTKLTSITCSALVGAVLLTSPVFAQSDPNRAADMSTTARADDRDDDGFDMGWLGLIGLAGLAGLRRKAPDTVTTRSSEGAARVYPSKS